MPRRYDKGEKRYKHVGKGPNPEIQFYPDDPRRFVGKCPAKMSDVLLLQLLNEAIAAPSGDRDIDYPKYLYVVHEGAIYEARTSDAGNSYHGFPYCGQMKRPLVERLKAMARSKGCLDSFEAWVKKYIEIR